jgi:hypothetical protein
MSMTAISSGSSNGPACDRSGQRLGLGWTEEAGVQFRSKTRLILINYLGALRSVHFLKRGSLEQKAD